MSILTQAFDWLIEFGDEDQFYGAQLTEQFFDYLGTEPSDEEYNVVFDYFIKYDGEIHGYS